VACAVVSRLQGASAPGKSCVIPACWSRFQVWAAKVLSVLPVAQPQAGNSRLTATRQRIGKMQPARAFGSVQKGVLARVGHPRRRDGEISGICARFSVNFARGPRKTRAQPRHHCGVKRVGGCARRVGDACESSVGFSSRHRVLGPDILQFRRVGPCEVHIVEQGKTAQACRAPTTSAGRLAA